MTTRKELDAFYKVLDTVTTSELAKFKALIVASLKNETSDKDNTSASSMFTNLILEALGVTSKAGLSYWFSPEALDQLKKA